MGQFTVTEEAARWYKDEMDLESGDYVQFFIKIYGGIPTGQPNYFLGLSVGKANNISVKETVEGITFFFNDRDAWFIEEQDMKVVKNEEDEETTFIFE